MRRYSIFHVPVMSFYSKALYRDVGLQWKGVGFAYLLLLLGFCWLPGFVRFQLGLSDFADNRAQKVISQMPRISIVGGEATVEAPQPLHVTDPETGQVLVIIDTTGTITSLAETEARVLVNRTEAAIKKNEIETRIVSFREINEFTVDQARVTGWLNMVRKFAAPVLYPPAVLGSFAYRVIQLLIYAAIGLLFASWCKSTLSYASLLRLAAVAVTPCIITNTVLGAAQVEIPVPGLWYFLISMGYLFFGVKAVAREQGPDEGQELDTEPT